MVPTRAKRRPLVTGMAESSGLEPLHRVFPAASIKRKLLLLLPMLAGCVQQEAFFCPSDGCADRLIEEINASSQSIHVCIAYFTHTDIAQALVNAQARGVEVKVLGEGDESRPGGINEDIVAYLKASNVPYRDDVNLSTMHHKFSVIDGAIVLTGSFNYTFSADQSNNENLVVLASPRMAAAFEDEFQDLWQKAEPAGE